MKRNLNELDMTRIVRRVLNEGDELKPIEDIGRIVPDLPVEAFVELGGVYKMNNNDFRFKDKNNKKWIVSKEWAWQQMGVNDEPRFIDTDGYGKPSREFSDLFNSRKPLV